MQRKHGDVAEFRRCGNGARHGVGDVVKLQVQEDLVTETREPVNDSRAFGCIKLVANLAQADAVPEPARYCKCRAKPVVIEGDD